MSQPNQPINHSEFELTSEMLNAWEQELDDFQHNVRNRLSLLSLEISEASQTEKERSTDETRSHDDAMKLANSINELLQ